MVGVGDYAHTELWPLQCAVADAEGLAKLLTEPDVCGFARNQVISLTNSEANRDTIVEHLSEWLPVQSRGADLAIIYFAGHGIVRTVGKNQEGYLLPHDADPRAPAKRGVAMSDLGKWMDALEARAVVLCLDCCHAGMALPKRGDGNRAVGLGPAVVGGLAGQGRFVMTSCAEGQESAEIPALRHGLFTYHLLEGIAGKGDRDRDGRVGVAELFEHVSEAVERDARKHGHEQKPWTATATAGGVYISTPRPRRKPPDPPEEGVEGAIAKIKSLMIGADEQGLLISLQQLEQIAHPLAVPLVVPYLTYKFESVGQAAKRVVQAIGIEQTFAAIEELARRNDEAVGAILDGLEAFEARDDLVRLLDHVVNHVGGELLVRASKLFHRKRLGLGLKGMVRLFETICSQYKLKKALGQGQYTDAYLAHDTVDALEVVVRVLRDDFVPNQFVRRQFLDVCKRSRKFVHQNLVQTLEVREFPDEKAYYTVRAFVTGATLREVLAGRHEMSGRRFAPLQVVVILRQLLGALAVVHEARACHGGVKPSNVFVCSGDRVILGDPAPALVAPPNQRDPQTAYDYRYIAPEVFRGEPVEPPADVYALGCVAHELFCGVPPFVSDNPADLLKAHLDGAICPFWIEEADACPEVDTFLLRLLARNAADRPSAEAALAELEEVRAALIRRKAPPAPSDPVWYYLVNGVQTGPVLLAELQVAAAEGKLSPPDLVWQEGTADWVPARTVAGLFAAPQPQPDTAPSTVHPALPPTSVPAPAPRTDTVAVPPMHLVRDESLVGYQPVGTFMTLGKDQPNTGTRPVSSGRADETGCRPGPFDISRIGRYEIQQVLGEGAFGRVYLAFDADLERQVAIKVPKPEGFTPDLRERFIREARATAKIHHPNVCPIYDVGVEGNLPYIVMHYMAGTTLAAYLEQVKVLPPLHAVALLQKLALGVAAAHAQGVIHRDLKPQNVLFDPSRQLALITDFGLARIGSQATATAAGAVFGTPLYMSPEQARGAVDEIGPVSDVYSLGVILYRMLTGKPPFEGGVYEVLIQHCETNPIPPSAVRRGLDPLIDGLCLKALAKKSADRFPSAKAFADALAEYARSGV